MESTVWTARILRLSLAEMIREEHESGTLGYYGSDSEPPNDFNSIPNSPISIPLPLFHSLISSIFHKCQILLNLWSKLALWCELLIMQTNEQFE